MTQQQGQLAFYEREALALKTRADTEIGKVRELAADAIEAEASGHAWESKYLVEHGRVVALEAALAEREEDWAAREEAHLSEMAHAEEERREAQVKRDQLRDARRLQSEEDSLHREQEAYIAKRLQATEGSQKEQKSSSRATGGKRRGSVGGNPGNKAVNSSGGSVLSSKPGRPMKDANCKGS